MPTLPPSVALFRHVILAAQRRGSRVLAERLRVHDLTPAWAEVLCLLDQFGPLTIRELGKRLICEADHPSRLVSRLETAGFVLRRPSAEDRRAFDVVLTKKGRLGARRVAEIEAKLDFDLLKRVSTEEIEQAVRILLAAMRDEELETVLQERFGPRHIGKRWSRTK